jgi:hypothetical protein
MPNRGWYDQRIRMVGVHDADFAKRVIRTVGLKGVCIESVCDGFINPIGLYDKWKMSEQHIIGELSLNRARAQTVRESMEHGDIPKKGMEDRVDIVGRDCSQYVLIHKGAGDERPYVDVALEWITEKWGGWGISTHPPGDNVQYVKQRVSTEKANGNGIAESFKKCYNFIPLYDPIENVYYYESEGSPRWWKEGDQQIADIDWHPYFYLEDVVYYGD